METRDNIYEDIMSKGWNEKLQMFCQSYESKDVLDSAVLIMPLVFFINPCDPMILETINKILLTTDKGGLTENSLVYRCRFTIDE